MIEYNKIKSGDTLVVSKSGKPHYTASGELAFEAGDKVQVDEVYPAGCAVKTEGGAKVAVYFEHGAEKLDYTPETKKAIADRESFGKKAPATGEKKPENGDNK